MTTTHAKLTFRALIDLILADNSLQIEKRNDVASGVRTFTKVTRLPIDTLVPSVPELRKQIAGFTPAMVGMKPGRWRNIRGHLQFALSHQGLATVPRRFQISPSAHWAELLDQLDYSARYKLSHIARYSTAHGIEPGQLDDAVMAQLRDDLCERSLKAEPERVYRDATVAWNRQVLSNPNWPQRQLTIPNHRDHYSIPWEKFPESLRTEIDAWLKRLSGNDLRRPSGRKPLREASIYTRKRQLHEYLSALVMEGTDPASMIALRDVVTPQSASTGMMFFWKRAGEAPSVHAGQIAGLIISIARHHARLNDEAIKKLVELRSMVAVNQTGMTERNAARLRPLDDPERVEDLALLPVQLLEEVRRQGEPTRTLAVQLQTALLIELLLLFPIRLKNLRHLRMDEHLIFGRHRDDLTIFIRPNQVKNEMPLEARLPESTGRLINLYVSKYRPLLDSPDSPWLFPGQKFDVPKCAESIRHQVKTTLWKRCGLDFRPHTFRHVAGKIILDESPGAHAQVQRLLGHKRLSTTVQFYTGAEGKSALAIYDATIMRLRGGAGGRGRDGKRGGATW